MDTFAKYGDAFALVIHGGTEALHAYAYPLAICAATLALMLTFKSVMFANAGVAVGSVRLLLIAGFYIFLLDHVQDAGEVVMSSAVKFGLTATGSSINPDAFLRSPDKIFQVGYARAADLFELATQACNLSSFGCVGNLGSWLPVVIAGWAVYLTFAFIAFLVLTTCMLFKIALLAGMILLPLAIFRPTENFGFMPIRAAIHFAVQIMILAMIVGLGTNIIGLIDKNIANMDPGIDSVTPLLLSTMIFGATVLGAMSLAYSLTSGAMLQAGAFIASSIGPSITVSRSVAQNLNSPVSTASGFIAKAGIQGTTQIPQLTRNVIGKMNLGRVTK